MQSFDVHIVENEFFGLYDALPGDRIPKGYFNKIDNAFCSDNKISKVFGSSTIAASIASQNFNGLAAFEKVSSSNKWLVVSINGASNAQLYQWSGSGNFTAIGSANLTNNQPINWAVANDILYGFNGTEVVSWDGTTVTKNPSSVPNGFYAEWFHNYLFVAKTSANPNRVFWSNLGDPTTFNGSNFVDINPGDSDQIMGLVGFPGQDELLVFKRNTIWSITGWSGTTFSTTTINTQNTNNRIFGYGTVSPFSIVPVGSEVFWFSMLGAAPVIRSLKRTSQGITLGAGVISDQIKGTMAGINTNQLALIAGGFDGRYVYWAVPTGSSTTNNQIIALDTWEIQSGKGIYPFITMSNKNAQNFATSTIPGFSQIYFTDATASTGLVYKFDTSVFTDNGTNVTMDVRTKDYASSGSNKTKWKYGYVTYDTGSAASVAVNARIDRATGFTNQKNISMQGNSPGLGSFILGTSVLGGQGTTDTRWGFAQMTGHYMGLQFKDTTANSVVLHTWELWGKRKPLRAN
ncbi:MAG: hypothetical protein C5B43_03480 [Verrucomicrobia bacterium]|nr:MAG: hypothetical protein C5B43_03480 [Verrucomicrobiota bacterium]